MRWMWRSGFVDGGLPKNFIEFLQSYCIAPTAVVACLSLRAYRSRRKGWLLVIWHATVEKSESENQFGADGNEEPRE